MSHFDHIVEAERNFDRKLLRINLIGAMACFSIVALPIACAVTTPSKQAPAAQDAKHPVAAATVAKKPSR